MLIETIGGLAKEEILKTVEHNIVLNTFVLESEEPYPGYHGVNLPTGTSPEAIFLMIRDKFSTEKVMRISQNVKKKNKLDFDAAPGKICIYNETYNCIRIRNIDNYEIISVIQEGYIKEGIVFMKKKKMKESGLIQLKKIFTLKPLDNDYYRDLDDERMYYIVLPKQVSWETFKTMTKNIKNNWENKTFDAALAAIYTKEVIDLVRIYSKDINLNMLNQIRLKYLKEFEKF